MIKYIDFHTHNLDATHHVLSVFSVHYTDLNKPIDSLYTLGRHPWYTKALLNGANQLIFKVLLTQNNCLGLGEIGLDKLKGAEIKDQLIHFRQLLKIANEEEISVVIHCVKSFDILMKLKKEYPNIKHWCIHGYRKNIVLANQLIKQGFYLSLTAKEDLSLNDINLITNLPLNRLFLETDDSGLCIVNFYSEVAKLKEMSVGTLKHQQYNNFKEFFNLSSFTMEGLL